MRTPILEPYIWYDPHKLVEEYEWRIFQLKLSRNIEMDHVSKIIKSALAEISYEQSKKTWDFEPFSGEYIMSIFLQETIRLLKERPKHITLALMAEEIDVTQPWIESLLYRKDCNPSVIQLEKLYNYLADKPFSFTNKTEEVYYADED